ncbi:MAG: hypothetical protein HC809_02935 [Gammaproteobacteria bacterium]|nr:hypothetical protein [Gammaproteobacteria bacterium]
MDLSLLAFCEWLAGTAGSIALHESLYMYPLVESTHVLTLMLFVGTLAMVDLRLLGFAFTHAPVSEVTARLLPWTVAGFVIMTITGLLLFYAIPVRTYQSIWFRVKVIVLIAAGLNAWFFHRRVQRDQTRWDGAIRPPRAARLAAAASLGCWAIVIVTGRMIAYNWFDCDRPQGAFVNWAAGCVVELSNVP